MFHTHSPYSPFFTSGLLSAGSRPHSPDVPLSPRRGSLPTSDSTREEEVSAFYFTLQPRRDEHEFRSFLSLDLAESQSMRSASLKRKESSRTKSFRFPRISEASMPPPPASLRMRFSRDSLRTIPSPKPAPSITLPELPKVARTPPRLPSIQLTPSLDISLCMPSTSTSPPRTVPRLRLNLAPAPTARRASVVTKATSSTVSTRARTHNRSEALARLEGRVRRPATAPLPAPRRNFMSMSDDEDSDSDSDAADADDDLSDLDSLDFPEIALLDPRREPEDVVLPLHAPTWFLEAPRSAPLPPRSPARPARGLDVRPPAADHLRRQRTRTGPAAEWFPLKSFIDLHAEPAADSQTAPASAREEGLRRVYGARPVRDSEKTRSAETGSAAGWKWRSFIEVAHVS